MTDYLCASCNNSFLTDESDEEELEQFEEIFGNVPDDETAIVCNACFHKMIGQVVLDPGSLWALMKPRGNA